MMLPALSLLLLSVVGQTSCRVDANGRQVCTVPARGPAGYAAPSPSGRLLYNVMIDGQVRAVSGWLGGDGLVHFYPNEQAPQPVPASPRVATPPAVSPPTVAADRGDAIPNYGLSPERMPQGRERVTAESPEARRFMRGALEHEVGDPDQTPVPRFHLTVIGSPDQRKAVLDDIASHPALAGVRGAVDVQAYSPEDWEVKDIFPAGKPSILLQEDAGKGRFGKVLYRAGDYSGGPARLAEEIRKANPSYRPDLDPGAGSAARCPLGFTSQHWPHVLVTVLLSAGLACYRKAHPTDAAPR